MTPEETKAAAAVMLAYADGKAIEWREKGDSLWYDVKQPLWHFKCAEYRVKPEPWSGKIWVHSDGRTASFCKINTNTFMLKNGYRLIDVKEVQP